MISTTTLTIDVTNKKGRVTDTTDYASLGISTSFFGLKGLGVIYFQGQQIVSKLTIGDPLIDLASGDTYFEFDLELDVNGEIANGVYKVDYSLYIDTTVSGVNYGAGVTLPNTFDPGASFQWLANFLEPGNTVTLYTPTMGGGNQDVTVLTAVYVDPNMTITTNETITQVWDFFSITLTNLQSSTLYTYSGCVQSPAKVNFTYDCEYGTNGTFAVSNATDLTGQNLLSLNATINYPAWTSTTPTFNSQIVTTSLPYSNNVLATGTFGVTLSEVIQKIQNDGLIITYTASVTEEFNVSCIGSLCNLIPCIESLRNAHAIELQRNRISKYQVFVDNVLLYYTESQNYRNCGEMDKYRATLALLEAQLDASGCECGCCDPDTYMWVNNSATSTIDSLINAIQFRFVEGAPLDTDDETKGVEVGALWEDISGLPGTHGILYVCVDNSPGNAVWEVYYDPNEPFPTLSAQNITYSGGGVYPSPTDVKQALDDTSTLITSQALSISNLYSALAVTNAAVAGKLNVPSPQIIGGTSTKVTYDNNGLIVAGTTLGTGDIPNGVSALKIGTGIVDNTEFGYLNGVTSNIQTQLNSKFPLNLSADTTLDYNNFKLTLSTGTNQTDIAKAQGASSSASALTVQARNAAAANGFGSSILLSANITGNSTQVPLSRLTSSWTDAAGGSSQFTLSTSKSSVETTKLTINSDGQLKLNEYNAANFPDPAPAYLLGVNASGEVVQASAASVKYVAGIVDNISSAFTIYGNTTGATITASGFGTSTITLTASSPVFTFGKTLVFFQGQSGIQTSTYIAGWASTNTITIVGYTNGVASWNNIIGAIKIEVYP